MDIMDIVDARRVPEMDFGRCACAYLMSEVGECVKLLCRFCDYLPIFSVTCGKERVESFLILRIKFEASFDIFVRALIGRFEPKGRWGATPPRIWYTNIFVFARFVLFVPF